MTEKIELQEIIAMIGSVREKLENMIIQYDEQNKDVSELDEAVDALSDAIEILEEVWSE
ncbi:MAG: hypothetical protein IKF90_25065 [Parasporobacterium sp.]|nr:hypothetical protein [Parasporobacterium sp.]